MGSRPEGTCPAYRTAATGHAADKESWTRQDVVLLHGVTSSGKTEIYIHLIEEQLREGKQVLYLLPEIALTGQIITRLRRVFGNRVGIYHSRFSDAERVETYQSVRKHNGFPLVLGVRSSVFLPFQNLGLVIVDEEHENTYKQFDPAPVIMPGIRPFTWPACTAPKSCWELPPLRLNHGIMQPPENTAWWNCRKDIPKFVCPRSSW